MSVRPRTGGGFTLLEVLVALAIVALGMAVVMGALSSSANALAAMRDKTFAQWVALNHIATVRLAGQPPPLGTSDGDSDFAGRSWHWRQQVVATQVPGVVRIDVQVRPADVKGDDEHGWFTTASGISGDAVGTPNGFQPDWGAQLAGLPGGGGANPLNPGAPGAPAPATPPVNPPSPTPPRGQVPQ